MNHRILFGASQLILGLFPLALYAQVDSLALRFANTITEQELMDHLRVIASDAYLGRDTGKEGQKLAAAYLRDQFSNAGIPPVPAPDPNSIVDGYFQRFDVIEKKTGTIAIKTGSDVYTYGKELLYFQDGLTANRSITELMYLPLAAKGSSYPVNGKIVLLNASELGSGKAVFPALRARMDELQRAGADLVLVRMEHLRDLTGQLHLGGSQMRLADQEPRIPEPTGIQMILVDAPIMDALIGKERKRMGHRGRKPRTMHVQFDLVVEMAEKRSTAENVLAFIEGTDKKDEVVILTAHYDHVGVQDGVVYNGADDNGTGTVAMIEIAQAFAQAKAAGHGPRRSVLVMTVSGEEKGLLGSRYYSEHPVFPLQNTVADINIDMIGRRDSTHLHSQPYIYVIGSDRLSSGLHRAIEQSNATYTGLLLDYTFNAEDDPNRFYYRSDHYNFARKGVPSVFFFSGVHEDYHQPGDDVEKIDPELLHQRTLLAFNTAWILADQENRIVVDKPVKP